MLSALLIGFIFGFFGSMPVAGPIAAIVVSRGLERRRRSGMLIALGSACAEMGYAFMAFWGLTAVVARYPVVLTVTRLAACGLLALLGLYFVARPPRPRPVDGAGKSPESGRSARSVLLGFSMTIGNPTLIVTWSAAVGIAQTTGLLRMNGRDAFPFAGGAGVGIVLWFALLLWLLGRLHERLRPATMTRLVRAMGVALFLIGIGLGVRVLMER
jgi:threonine/homoserine/homoserine lactone efflux protein